MFVYEKKLQYPVKIKNTNPKLAALIISQYGGPYPHKLRSTAATGAFRVISVDNCRIFVYDGDIRKRRCPMGDIDAIFAFAIAFVFYGAGPLYLASERKKLIRKLQYWIFCVLYDAIIFIVLQLITGNAISLSGLAVAMLIFGTIFYFIGLVILRKRGMVAVPSAQPTVPQPPVKSEDVSAPASQTAPAQPDTPLSITETWYTCPSCGCLLPTGEVCSCGYHPPMTDPPQSVR